MLSVTIAPALVQRFNNIHVLAFRVKGLRLTIGRIDTSALVEQACIAALTRFGSVEKMMEMALYRHWREAYGELGIKPSKFRASVEALSRRALAGKSLICNIPSVDFYNAYSIRFGACIGVYDCKKLSGDPISLREAAPEEDRFEPWGAEKADFPLNPQLAVYAQGSTILCWGFNCRDARHSALDEESDEALFFTEGVSMDHVEASLAAMLKMRQVLIDNGAEVSSIQTANAKTTVFDI
jgi:DNA/RNA-binding domain of Phe-tRNA-synthetase-like protein